MKPTTHFHPVPRSRMRGTIPLLPQYVFMARCSVKAQGGLIIVSNVTRGRRKLNSCTNLYEDEEDTLI
jgi:hypothetical protein